MNGSLCGNVRRLGLTLALAAAALLTGSCQSGRKAVYPVHGRVIDARGKGAAGAVVVLHPVDAGDKDADRPVGKTDEDGRFTLTTYNEGDGAPAGEYRITITWPAPRKSPLDPEGGDQLHGKLADSKSSTIRFTVTKGADNEVPDIRLP